MFCVKSGRKPHCFLVHKAAQMLVAEKKYLMTIMFYSTEMLSSLYVLEFSSIGTKIAQFYSETLC